LSELDRGSSHRTELGGKALRRLDELLSIGANLLVQAA